MVLDEECLKVYFLTYVSRANPQSDGWNPYFFNILISVYLLQSWICPGSSFSRGFFISFPVERTPIEGDLKIINLVNKNKIHG